MDDTLPFWYWTLNERFTDEFDCFDQPQEEVARLHKVTRLRRQDSSIMAASRCTLPIKNKQTIRQKFFTPEDPLPPVPQKLLAAAKL